MNHPAYKSNKVFYMLHLIATMIIDLGTFQKFSTKILSNSKEILKKAPMRIRI